MAGMEQIETAVGEADALPLEPPAADLLQGLLRRQELVCGRSALDRGEDLARLSDGGAELSDDDARGDIGQARGLFQRRARRDRGRPSRR
jgi:hypothetical protein